MKNILPLLFFFASTSAYAQILHLSADSLYRVVIDNYALTDSEVGYSSEVDIIDEVFNTAVPNSPTMNSIDELSHAQLWSVIAEKEGRFHFKNYKTGRVILTDKILPAEGLSWRQASEDNQWENLPIGTKEGRLFMGPDPKDVNLGKKVTYFLCDASDNAEISDRGYLYPTRNDQSSLVFISYQNPVLNRWSVTPCYIIGDPNIPKDPSSSGIDNIGKEKPFVQIETGLNISEPCNIYTIGGVAWRNLSGVVTLQTGVYIVQSTVTGFTWKVAIP